MIITDRNGVKLKNDDLLFTEEAVYDSKGILSHTQKFFCKVVELSRELYLVDCDKDGKYNKNQLQIEINVGSIRERYETSRIWKKCLATNIYPIDFSIINNKIL